LSPNIRHFGLGRGRNFRFFRTLTAAVICEQGGYAIVIIILSITSDFLLSKHISFTCAVFKSIIFRAYREDITEWKQKHKERKLVNIIHIFFFLNSCECVRNYQLHHNGLFNNLLVVIPLSKLFRMSKFSFQLYISLLRTERV
jgi:hypothetical protein